MCQATCETALPGEGNRGEWEYRLVTLLLSDFACKIRCSWNRNLDIYVGRNEKIGIAEKVIDPFPL